MRIASMGLAAATLLGGCRSDANGDGAASASSSDSDDGLPTTIAPGDDGGTATTSGTTADGVDESTESDDSTGIPMDVPPIEGDDCGDLEALVQTLQSNPPDGDALIDAFFRDVAYGAGGFPIIENDRICFAYRDLAGVPLSVVGDFNTWVVGEPDLEYAASEFDLRYAIVEVPAEDADGLYKFVRTSPEPEYFADPWARRFGWDEFGEYSRLAVDPAVSHYERWPRFDAGAGDLQARDVVVFVPPGGFDETDLAVLYMHDGQNLFAPDAFFGGWRAGSTVDFAIADGSIPPLLVVGIDNTSDRFDEYTHVADDLGGELVGGSADEYADFVVDGLRPFIDTRYPTALDPARTGVAGSSLGGLVSLYIGWRHPDVFGSAGSMSGTVGWGSFGAGAPTLADLFAGAPPLALRLYLDSGGTAGSGCPGSGSDNYCDNLALAGTLRSLGWQDEDDLFYRWESGAAHNEAEWAERFPAMIRDWFPGNLP